MVVDDNRDAADTMVLLLRIEGFKTAVAYSGERALSVAEDFDPDFVLLDLNMPGLDGFETAERLSSRSAACLIALSADTSPSTASRLQTSPFKAHLIKPTTLEAIYAAFLRCSPAQ